MPLDRLALRRRLEQGIEGADAFDASKTINQYAQGAWGSISDALTQQLHDLEGEQGNTGRFRSGFYDVDRGDILKTGYRRLADDIAMQAPAVARMQMDANNETYGRTQSLYELDEQDYRDEQERKRKRRSGIGSALGGLLGAGAGAFVGGPTGASIGAKIGSGIGGSF